jgi:hypothetical protein
MKKTKFGFEIVSTTAGRFYWDEPLKLVNFVPTGTRTSSHGIPMYSQRNTLQHATRVALNYALTIHKDE